MGPNFDEEGPMSRYLDAQPLPPRTLTDREQRLLLKLTGERRAGWRDHVLFSLAFGTGLREHELLALDAGDVLDADLVRARRHVVLRVFKRASQAPAPQQVVVPDTVRRKLEALFAARRREGEVITATSPTFVSRLGRRLSARQVRRVFWQWQERAGFDRRLTFHSTRHSACTNVYRRTKDIRLTQRFARHRSLLSTMIYTHPLEEDLVQVAQLITC
jgi:site-specific recombinase XerC